MEVVTNRVVDAPGPSYDANADALTYTRMEEAAEMRYVGAFWALVDSGVEEKLQEAWSAMSIVKPEHVGSEDVRKLYVLICDKMTQGQSVNRASMIPDYEERKIDGDTIHNVVKFFTTKEKISHFTKSVIEGWQRRTMVEMCSVAANALRNGHGKQGGRSLAEKMSMRIMTVFSNCGDAKFLPNDVLTKRSVERTEETVVRGFNWPWQKMTEIVGPAVPGEVYGLSGYSGCGKSTLADNIAFGMAEKGQPVIVFSTEMGEMFLDRGIAAMADVSQFRAEKRRWTGHDEEKKRFQEMAATMTSWPWAMVTRPTISPGEVAAAVRVLRKRWLGQTVLVIVDHMHRLNYGGTMGASIDEGVGPSTKAFRDMAMEDEEGGLVFLLLYQPRKPEQGGKIYRPVQAHEIRGHLQVWNELNGHFSPYRQWVETDQTLRPNPWGTRRTKMKGGEPVFAKGPGDNAKLDDEHVYIAPDKLRIGGEGERFFLPFRRDSGRIYDLDGEPMVSKF